MPKSTPAEMHELRLQLQAVAGAMCEWPYCDEPGEQMAHLHHRGMGGSREANVLANVAWLCIIHHDLLDGRVGVALHRLSMNGMLTSHLQATRRAFVV